MGEFDLIAYIKELLGARGAHIGDDCAVLPAGQGRAMVLTTDMLVEGEHFVRAAITPFELGGKALSVNLSDVAAMGAHPTSAMLSLGLPGECTGAWAQEFMRGFAAVAAQFDIALIGGDMTLSRQGVAVNVVAIGEAPEAHIKRRGDAQVGDSIAVAGKLGTSAAGLRDVLAGRYDTDPARIHHNPAAQVAEGVWLGAQPNVHAMIDLSDGLASDLPHILKVSRVGAAIDLERIPTDHSLQDALVGGEDYKLLFTFSGELRPPFEHYVVGRIVAGEPRIEWRREGAIVEGDFRGFTHF